MWHTQGGKPGKLVEPKKERTPDESEDEDDEPRITTLAFSSDGQFLAVADGDTRVVKVDAPSESVSFPVNGNVLSVAFSADGERIATADRDGIEIWDRHSPAKAPERVHYQLSNFDSGNTVVIAFDDDGYLIAADDYTARLWDVRGGRVEEIGRVRLQESRSGNSGSMISPNGAFVATTLNARAKIWQLRPAAVIANACERLSRTRLTKNEWENEFGKEPSENHYKCEERPADRSSSSYRLR